ncbi:predicted protein [Arabidopsis lyrata subsp. lyrata]|uniref:Predicted protein n=1 Tax=Arabidopsis lyrata subsp. lyrata TaxID=81972 RepID=D7KE04_ARALL|nr:predicted protein [Arabidopsis lyrata subsp. lyrata]
MKWKLKLISSKSEEQPTLFTSGDRSCYRLSSPPTLRFEIGDKFNRSSSFDSKSVTIGL